MALTDSIATLAGCNGCEVVCSDDGRGGTIITHRTIGTHASRTFAHFEESAIMAAEWLRSLHAEQADPVLVFGSANGVTPNSETGGLTEEQKRRSIFPPNEASDAEFHRRWDGAVIPHRSDEHILQSIRTREREAWVFGARWGAEQERAHWEDDVQALVEAARDLLITFGHNPSVYESATARARLTLTLKPFEPPCEHDWPPYDGEHQVMCRKCQMFSDFENVRTMLVPFHPDEPYRGGTI